MAKGSAAVTCVVEEDEGGVVGEVVSDMKEVKEPSASSTFLML